MTAGGNAGLNGETVKACCAAGYSTDLVSVLLGDSYHPGGLDLTRHLLERVGLAAGQRLVDVASGRGATALVAAAEYGARVEGVDLSAANVARAGGAVAAAGLGDRARFTVGDAEAVPLPDGCADVVVCECALCTFPDKPTAMAEMARILVPGGVLGITDVAADRDRLPAELTGLTAWIACVADARPAAEYAALARSQGLRPRAVESHTPALVRMIDQIEARLEVLRMTARPRLAELGVDLTRVAPVVAAVRRAVGDGTLDYVLMVAEKPCA